MLNIVRPIQIVSPISGNPVNPRITERVEGNLIFVEAVWIDPNSGTFLSKGITKIMEKGTRKDITHKYTSV